MAWLTTAPTAIIVSRNEYYEERTSPDDEDVTQVRKRITNIREYRGVDYATALTISVAVATGAQTVSYEIAAIGGGGYTVTETDDIIIGNWSDKY